MTSQKEQAILDLRFIVNDSPTVFTFATRYYNATRAGLSRSEKNELGGFEIDIDLSLVIQLYADFTSVNVTPPAVGSNVIVADRKSTRLNSSHIPLSRMPSSA